MELWTDLAVKFAAIQALAGELGYRRALQWLGEAQLGPDPLASLPKATTAAERGTHAQLGPALRVYLHLRAKVGAAEALRLTRVVVVGAGKAFLARRVSGLDPARWRALSEGSRRETLVRLGAGFPNAVIEVDQVEEAHFSFQITACRFVELCHTLEVPELAPVFCAADEALFAEGPVRLERPRLLSSGDAHCAFEFSLQVADSSESGETGETGDS